MRRRISGLAALALLVGLALVGMALPVSASGNVIDDQQFIGDYGGYAAPNEIGHTGWIVYGTYGATLQANGNVWAGLYSFQQATGVLYVSSESVIRKTWILSSTGTYRLVGRAAQKGARFGMAEELNIYIHRVGDGVSDYDLGTIHVDTNETYYTFVSDPVAVSYSNYILTIELQGATGYDQEYWLYDYLRLEWTPDGSPTPVAYATAMPTPTCVNTTTTVHVVLPSPTPSAVDWSFADHFSGGWIWGVTGEAGVNRQYNYYPDAQGAPQSAQINYQAHIVAETSDTLTNTLVFEANFPTPPTHVYGWVQAPVLPAGEHAYLNLWAYDGLLWYRQGETEIGAGEWYMFTLTVTPSISVTALAFTGWRTDVAMASYFVVDDVAIVGSTRYRPRCDGAFLAALNNITPIRTDVGGAPIVVTWPANKPCPGNITQPNNFWGGLFAGLTMLLDVVLAWAPYHDPQFSLTTIAQNLMAGPFGAGIAIISVYMDPTIPLLAAATWIVLQLARGIISIFMWIKRLIPFLN